MTVSRIPKSEFDSRTERVREKMEQKRLDLLMVYGDEYRKENLRYASNYWPLFERGAVFILTKGKPVVVGAPECEKIAKEMSVWEDIRLIPDFACVTVPDVIDFPLTSYTSFTELFTEFQDRQPIRRMGIVGLNAASIKVYQALSEAFKGVELVDANQILLDLRLIKSSNEIQMLKRAGEIADIAYEELLKMAIPGKMELEVAASAEGAARAAGAEQIVFTIFGSGERSNTIIGRPTEKIIQKGEIIMASIAVQYQGYVATVEFPFVANEVNPGIPSSEQRKLIDALMVAEEKALKFLCPHVKQKEFVREVKEYFRQKGLSQYDVYPPLHGIGLAEAESPYPNEKTESEFVEGMTVNVDISLFEHPAGSNRIEEGFIITNDGFEPLSKLVRQLCHQWLKR